MWKQCENKDVNIGQWKWSIASVQLKELSVCMIENYRQTHEACICYLHLWAIYSCIYMFNRVRFDLWKMSKKKSKKKHKKERKRKRSSSSSDDDEVRIKFFQSQTSTWLYLQISSKINSFLSLDMKCVFDSYLKALIRIKLTHTNPLFWLFVDLWQDRTYKRTKELRVQTTPPCSFPVSEPMSWCHLIQPYYLLD